MFVNFPAVAFSQPINPATLYTIRHAAKTDYPRDGALLTRMREERMAIYKHLIFFDLKWVKVPD